VHSFEPPRLSPQREPVYTAAISRMLKKSVSARNVAHEARETCEKDVTWTEWIPIRLARPNEHEECDECCS
ncbi:MAG TPA: hypothetical protein VLH80_09850, partial [Nitrospiraceae bacterium]|nr:hypothetical protein [Nitrospiraceae bacterium]